MGNWDLPDIYAFALGPAALGLGYIYQVNPLIYAQAQGPQAQAQGYIYIRQT